MGVLTEISREVLVADLTWFARQAVAPRRRSMREFAEEELIIPDGPFKGRKFRVDRQPFTGLWLDAVDSGLWRRHVATGPTQSGKTLIAFCLPIMYFLFELEETVICGVPDLNMVQDKWTIDLLPAIEATRYRELLPRKGPGSRGGTIKNSVQFRNGTVLRFMSGGGNDKQRAAFTSRILVITETDGMDMASSTSREADKITQLEKRTQAYGDRAQVFMECTVSVTRGRTWQEYTKRGTESRAAMVCPKCGEYVLLGREHLVGWQEARTRMEAIGGARYVCPACGEGWSEEERVLAARGSVLVSREREVVHGGARGRAGVDGVDPVDPVDLVDGVDGVDAARGRAVADGVGEGDKKNDGYGIRCVCKGLDGKDDVFVGRASVTDTFSFRWSAPDNLFVSAGFVGGDEWSSQHGVDQENSEKSLRQFCWALPVEDMEVATTPLEIQDIFDHVAEPSRGTVPLDAEFLVGAMDLGKHVCHWGVMAVRPGGSPHVVDYGVIEVPWRKLGVDEGLWVAMCEWRDLVEEGWPGGRLGDGRGRVALDQVGVDSGGGDSKRAWNDIVYRFCHESGPPWIAMKGYGVSQDNATGYHGPKGKSNVVRELGDGYHVGWVSANVKDGKGRVVAARVKLLEVNADHWKSYLRDRLSTPIGAAGAMTLCGVPRVKDHMSLAHHLLAEREVQEYVAGKGMVLRWDRVNQNNHYGDVFYMCCVLAHRAGARVVGGTRTNTDGQGQARTGQGPRDGLAASAGAMAAGSVAAAPRAAVGASGAGDGVVRDWFARRRGRR